MANKEKVIDMPLDTKYVAETLKLSESVIRKYSKALEEAGHRFDKSGTTRLFKPEDVELFRMINKMTENSKLNVEYAVAVVMSSNTQKTRTVAQENNVIPANQTENQQHVTDVAVIKNELKIQQNIIHSLAELIAKQNEEMLLQKAFMQKQNEETESHHRDLLDKFEQQNQDNKELKSGFKDLKTEYEQQVQVNQDLNNKLQLAVDMLQKVDDKLDKLEEKEKKSFFKRLFG